MLNTEATQLQTAELKGRDDNQTDDNWKKQQLEPAESSVAQLSEQHQPQIFRVDYLTREETSSPIPPHGSQERPQQQQQAPLSKQQSSSPSTFSSRFRQSLSISERSSSTKFESSSSAKFTSANRSPTPTRISNVIQRAADQSTAGQSKFSRHESLEAVTTTACSETETDLMTQSFTISQESELFTRLGENQAPTESLPFFSCNNLITLCNNDVEELRQLLDLERQRFKWVEEKAAQLEKETSMLNYELNMLYQRQQRERKLLKEDNERLREQLNSMVNRLQAAASTSAAKDPRCTCDRQRQTTRSSKTRSSSTSAMRDPSLDVSRRSRHNSSQDADDLQQQCSSSRRHHHHHHHYHCSKQRSSTVVTEQEAALRFLRDSFYFYLIDREANDHLTAIMNILNFTNEQRARVLDRRGVSKL
ncbi:Protein quick-to-court [Trichinella pseudospiralis]